MKKINKKETEKMTSSTIYNDFFLWKNSKQNSAQIKNLLAKNMREKRLSKGVTISHMARKLNMSVAALSMIERGKMPPRIEIVKLYQSL